jgi:hypothetical protein
MSLDFTLPKYREMCRAILASGYSVWPIACYMAARNTPDLVVVLRHDIDRRPGNALRMARLEYELGLQATYYVRMIPSVFCPTILKEIAAIGHEIGYHYETLTRARGNPQQAIALFEQELARLRQICDIQTISMHGSPLSPYDNRDLWRYYDFRQFNLLGETYLSLDYGQLVYLTDTGRSWAKSRYNLRDKVAQERPIPGLKTTDDLISAIYDHRFTHVCILTHPERWAQSTGEWIISLAVDWAVNLAKVAIQSYRMNRN